MGEIGNGSYATVIKHEIDGEPVAIKVFKTKYKGVDTMLRELELLSTFDHNNVVKFKGVYNDTVDTKKKTKYDSKFHIIMELATTCVKDCNVDIKMLAADILLALEYIHGMGVIHRDLSHQNILYCDKNKKYMICDFGMSTYCGYNNHNTFTYGNALTRSPELYAGRTVDYSTDIWSLGVILYSISMKKRFDCMSKPETILKYIPELPNRSTFKDWVTRCANYTRITDTGEEFEEYYNLIREELNLDEDFKDFLLPMLSFYPKDRPTAHELLQHPYLDAFRDRIKEHSVDTDPRIALFPSQIVIPDKSVRNSIINEIKALNIQSPQLLCTIYDIVYRTIDCDITDSIKTLVGLAYSIAYKYMNPTLRQPPLENFVSGEGLEELEIEIIKQLNYRIQYHNPWTYFFSKGYDVSSSDRIESYYEVAQHGKRDVKDDMNKIAESKCTPTR